MRRLILAAPVLLATLGLVTPAQAAVERKAVAKSAAAIARYWSPERMRHATPGVKLRAAGGKAAKRSAAYPFTSSEVATPYTQAPTSTDGKVFFTLGSVDYMCSGTALLSPNKSVVWTAGHCVNEGPGAFATNWTFVPAYKDGAAPLGRFPARSLYTTSGWRDQGDFAYDLGAAVVGPSAAGQALTDVTGGRGIGVNYIRNQRFTAYGYPAAPPFNGERLWLCDAAWAADDTTGTPPPMAIGCDMTAGSSGGGWIVGSSVYSVNSYGYTAEPNVIYGPYQGTDAAGLYNQAAAG